MNKEFFRNKILSKKDPFGNAIWLFAKDREPLKALFILLLLAMLPGCASKLYVYKSTWQRNPVYIYGNASDKYVPATFYTDEDTKLNYSVSNDSNYLFIFIETNNDATVSGLTQNGLQIWIDTTGKKNHQVGIICPFPQKAEYAPNNNQRQRNWNNSNYVQQTPNSNAGNTDTSNTSKQNANHSKFIERAKQIHITGFKTVPDGVIKLPDTLGINVGVSWDNTNDLEYEVAISLKSFLKYPIVQSDSSKILNISFDFNTIPKRTNNNGGGGSGFRPSIGFGMGMGMTGVMLGGGGGGRNGGGAPEPQSAIIWRAFCLSTIPR